LLKWLTQEYAEKKWCIGLLSRLVRRMRETNIILHQKLADPERCEIALWIK